MKQPRKSKLKLIREVYISVKMDEDNYYFKEIVYSSRWDGFIDLVNIDEDLFNKALEDDESIEIRTFGNTRLNIKNEILKLRRTS